MVPEDVLTWEDLKMSDNFLNHLPEIESSHAPLESETQQVQRVGTVAHLLRRLGRCRLLHPLQGKLMMTIVIGS